MSDQLGAALSDLVRELIAEEVARQLPDAVAANGSPSPSPWLTVREAAEYLRVSERQVHRLLKRGRVRSSTIGRRRLLHRDDLDKTATGEE